MKTLPFTFRIEVPDYIPSHFDNHITRRLSAMKGQFLDRVQTVQDGIEIDERMQDPIA